MLVLDTTVAVDHLRGLAAATALLSRAIEENKPIAASEVVRFELLAGVRDEELERLEQFFLAVTWVPVGQTVSRAAGELAREYRGSHTGIDTADYVIAATALLLDADLLTTNLRHFPMFPDLTQPY